MNEEETLDKFKIIYYQVLTKKELFNFVMRCFWNIKNTPITQSIMQ